MKSDDLISAELELFNAAQEWGREGSWYVHEKDKKEQKEALFAAAVLYATELLKSSAK